MPQYHIVTTLEDLPPGSIKAYTVETRRVVLLNIDGRVYALDDRCTHDGALLSEGTLDGTTIICPWHNAEFDVTCGKVLCPPATEDVRSYAVSIAGNQIAIEM